MEKGVGMIYKLEEKMPPHLACTVERQGVKTGVRKREKKVVVFSLLGLEAWPYPVDLLQSNNPLFSQHKYVIIDKPSVKRNTF